MITTFQSFSRFAYFSARLLMLACLLVSTNSSANELKDLLRKIQQNQTAETTLNQQREQQFSSQRNLQQQLLNDLKKSIALEELRSKNLNKISDDNEKKLATLETSLDIRSGELKELFGAVRQFSGDNRGLLQASMISNQYPKRQQFLNQMAESKSLPNIQQLEQFWLEIYREMVESGQITRYSTDVVFGQGSQKEQSIVRIGSFNAVSQQGYLDYSLQTGQFEYLARQPESSIKSSAIDFFNAEENQYAELYIDPSRGQILSRMVQNPDFEERISQGGPVAYIIITLGAIGILLAITLWLRLFIIQRGIKRQSASEQVVKTNTLVNPLSEVIQVFNDNQGVDSETLELKLDEAIIRNIPKIEWGIGLIKLIASVAPLLGLLGTVVGMIATFQAITIFGTGDPKLMANGISEALVTTMLGLIVAIPTLFAHSLVSSRSRRIIQQLQQQTAGFIARQRERQQQSPPIEQLG
ncbi:MotA/TolQ/ExbB proton channel family protein [Pelagibaculum spongiae]|uniref:Biopolymer transporter ExbB n=1 Tax=Pelagibaculum spongiae TaxID=2080658 RepID=A0A2V1H5A8_9GAMM|nr:MotA/TolQ/ExbB proton channel family protein [Pelagibaculum spongiae]PVZ72387.1 biopolymer transporter ExbB [Pelagibaculum spongiae]